MRAGLSRAQPHGNVRAMAAEDHSTTAPAAKSSSPRPRLPHWANPIDLAGMLFAVVYALPSLTYPLAPDQSLFYYIGNGWLDGKLPYRDLFDQKPPGIFELYATALRLLGRRMWAVHLFEIVGVLIIGALIAYVVQPKAAPQSSHRKGLVGLSCVVVSVIYYSSFDYWSLGQVEFWQGMLALASCAMVWRSDGARWRAFAAGALAGLSLAFKPALPIFAAAALAGWRAGERKPKTRAEVEGIYALLLFGTGLACALAIVLLPFELRHQGMSSLVDAVFVYSRYYVTETKNPFYLDWVHTAPAVLLTYALALGAVGVARSQQRSDRLRAFGFNLALFVLAVGTVAGQQKYLGYHWVVVMPFLALIAVWAIGELCATLAMPLVALMASTLAYTWASTSIGVGVPAYYGPHIEESWRYLTQRDTAQQFADHFFGPFGNNYGDLNRLAAIIKSKSHRDDTLCVRGYRPAIYLLTGLNCPSRFPWEQHLGDIWQPPLSVFPERDLRRVWGIEHHEALRDAPPTFVVTFAGWPADIEGLHRDGYVDVANINGAVVLKRIPPVRSP